ncbi:hypothetical protein K2173_011602 [Erythroxylum novogranatense]|uniref:Protein kinase domain-containing protein n=1 Tax=Erythroxylum novogranatense TaxID=1862640 RepID=A0AAV8U7N6_9ROSI|nr:hypothetical protein K2173_011602 [Erythroxylum novogranatense]
MRFTFLIHATLVLWLSQVLAVSALLAKPGCSEYCGNVAIPFPFGVEAGCYMNENFAVACNNSFGSQKPFLTRTGMELLGVSMKLVVQVNNPVISATCNGSSTPLSPTGADLSGTPFIYSSTYTRFTAIGCNNYATFGTKNKAFVGGCLSICNGTQKSGGCYGLNCCQTTIPPNLNSFNARMANISGIDSCRSNKTSFMVDQGWLDNRIDDLDRVAQMEVVPSFLEWGTIQGSCGIAETSSLFCSTNGFCWTQLSPRHLCVCETSNYVTDSRPINSGCEGGSCMDLTSARCNVVCMYAPGNYSCPCPDGYRSVGNNSITCKPRLRCASGFGFLLLLGGVWRLYKLVKRRKIAKLKEKYFRRNGGLLLQQQLESRDSNLEQTKLFTSKELEKATDNYNENRIIGQGGQGTVYKGMTTDAKLVAIKKSKIVDEGKLQEFINEVVILSNINHRNVVKLLGCCLETEVPLLVYEFVPNGTLFQHLRDPIEEFPLTWELRLRIATEVAGAVSYLHSAASMPIYHRDIKSANILLDEKFRAKVSDFGISKSVAVDQTHVTTRVQGTFGYLDPEYFQSSQYTEKSDVYSFGVVLIELLTGQKPIRTTSEEEKSLVAYFLVSMEENRLSEILDARVLREGAKEEVIAVAKVAKRCLHLNGKKRPTMKAVAMELEAIRSCTLSAISQQEFAQVHVVDDEYDLGDSDTNGSWEMTSSSTNSHSTTVDVQVQPLLFKTAQSYKS